MLDDAVTSQPPVESTPTRPVRVVTVDIVHSLGIHNGMSADDIDAKIEAYFIARGECD
jgi:hypothetical protein